MAFDPIRLAQARALARTGTAKRIRCYAGLSLSEVADACGVDQSTVHRWETGKRSPRGAAALRYVGLLEALERAAQPSTGRAS